MKKFLYPKHGNVGTTKPAATPWLSDPTDQKASSIRAKLERLSFAGPIGIVAFLLLMGMAVPALFAALVADASEAAAQPVKGLGVKHALLIGNWRYANPAVWRELETIPQELKDLGQALTSAGFNLYQGKVHENLPLRELRDLMRDFVTKHGVGRSKQDDQLLIFFSGHGLNVQSRGYIVPVDALGTSPDEEAFLKGAIPFNEIESLAKTTDVRHLLFVFDSCFSGDLFDFRSAEVPPLPALPRAVAKIAEGKARLFMTAGKAGEKVPARSQFTPFFTRGIMGEADTDPDGYVTGHELYVFLQKKVVAATNNTPCFAPLPGAEYQGDFVFRASLPLAEPPPFAVENLNELFEGSALTSSAPVQQANELKKVQAALFRAQLYGGEHDGRMSPAVVTAIRIWQRRHNVPDNGRLDAITLATFASETNVAVRNATTAEPFVNSLNIPFVPVPGTKVLFAVWETRIGDYIRFAEATNRPWSPPDFLQTNAHPVVNVTWGDAKEFCRWLSVREGVIYRLPTGEEWSQATGVVSQKEALPLYPWGDGFPPIDLTANIADASARNVVTKPLLTYNDGYARTAPAGRMLPNRYGISDLGGNVWEWCADSPTTDPGTNSDCYCRGGSWRDSDKKVLSTLFHLEAKADERSTAIGFRIVLTVPPLLANKDARLAEAVAQHMLKMAASYADGNVGRENTPELVSSFLALFDLPLKYEWGGMVPYSAAGVSYVACRAYRELKVGPDTPIDTETLRKALPEVRDLLFSPSPVIQVMKADAQERRSWVEVRDASPKPGWLAVFAWTGNKPQHIGIVESIQDGQLTTIEFNTSAPDAPNGGNVARKVRDLKYVLGYIKTY